MGRAKAFPARSFSFGSRSVFRRALKAGAAFLPVFRRFAARCMIGYLTPGVRLSAGKRGREGKALPHRMTPGAESSGVRRFGCKLRVSVSFGPAHAGRLRPGVAGPSCQRKGLQEQGSVVPGAWLHSASVRARRFSAPLSGLGVRRHVPYLCSSALAGKGITPSSCLRFPGRFSSARAGGGRPPQFASGVKRGSLRARRRARTACPAQACFCDAWAKEGKQGKGDGKGIQGMPKKRHAVFFNFCTKAWMLLWACSRYSSVAFMFSSMAFSQSG